MKTTVTNTQNTIVNTVSMEDAAMKNSTTFKKSKIMLALAMAGGLALQGCSTTPTSMREIQAENQEKITKSAETINDNMPDWYASMDDYKDNDQIIYARAMASGITPNLADEMANAQLHRALVSKIKAETDKISTGVQESSINLYEGEQQSSENRDVTQTSSFGVATTYKLIKQKTVFANGKFNVFLLAEFPIGKWKAEQLQKQSKQEVLSKSYQGKVEDLRSEKEKYLKKQEKLEQGADAGSNP